MRKVKVIANYLPQYHQIKENDKWWGEGYTDWTAVKNSRPLFDGHNQPRVPLNGEYYDLSIEENIKKQIDLANSSGIYGFGIYHYWFSSEMQLLTRPVEIIYENSDWKTHYMFIWDNGSWKRSWSNVKRANDWAPLYEGDRETQSSDNGVLAELKYGGKDEWKKHFDYLLPYFLDKRYIRTEDGKPLFMFFNVDVDPKIVKDMADYWNELAVESGFPGICFLGKVNIKNISLFDYGVDYEPGQHGWLHTNIVSKCFNRLIFEIEKKTNKLHFVDYDKVWNSIINDAEKSNDNKRLFSAFVDYDDSPRRGKNGHIMQGGSPEKFKIYMRQLLSICDKKNKPYVFLTAWNEWGEGAYLEPDETNGGSYLKALSDSIYDR